MLLYHSQWCEKLKNMFVMIGVFSSKKEFMCGNASGAMKWIEGEIEAFDEVLTVYGDFSACVGAWGTISLFVKARCGHVKTIIQPEFKLSVDDIQQPSTRVLGRRFIQIFGLLVGERWQMKLWEKMWERFLLIFCFTFDFFEFSTYTFYLYEFIGLQRKLKQEVGLKIEGTWRYFAYLLFKALDNSVYASFKVTVYTSSTYVLSLESKGYIPDMHPMLQD